MHLESFTAKNYRSISDAYKLPLSDYTAIVGPNNEGKSNILKALALSLGYITNANSGIQRSPSIGTSFKRNKLGLGRVKYDWDNDFPIHLQDSKRNGKSEFICEFKFTEIDFTKFKSATQINLSTNLKVKISFGNEILPKLDFIINGKAKLVFQKKKLAILKFIEDNIYVQYIPAIRTSEMAINIIEGLLERELLKLERNPEFQKIIKSINKLQQPILKEITSNLKGSILNFIPDVKSISIKNTESVGRLISASCSVFVDDGTETELQYKGDGVISLSAISLLQYASKRGSLGKKLILLLEEPESHLHPKAIHNLKNVLSEISKENQVIITTHSPIMVDKLTIKSNIIIQSGKAVTAKNITDIRNSLGITLSDNLSSAFLVLLVEGEEDSVILKSLLTEKSVILRNAFSSGILIIDHLGGATNISFKASFYKNNLCNAFAYLDNDESGRNSLKDAQRRGFIKDNEYILCNCPGMLNSEIEDIIDLNSYRNEIIEVFGVDLNNPKFKTNRNKWSDRVKEVFRLSGKLWSDDLEIQVKNIVSATVAKKGLSSLNQHHSDTFFSLLESLENILSKR